MANTLCPEREKKLIDYNEEAFLSIQATGLQTITLSRPEFFYESFCPENVDGTRNFRTRDYGNGRHEKN